MFQYNHIASATFFSAISVSAGIASFIGPWLSHSLVLYCADSIFQVKFG